MESRAFDAKTSAACGNRVVILISIPRCCFRLGAGGRNLNGVQPCAMSGAECTTQVHPQAKPYRWVDNNVVAGYIGPSAANRSFTR